MSPPSMYFHDCVSECVRIIYGRDLKIKHEKAEDTCIQSLLYVQNKLLSTMYDILVLNLAFT